MGPNTVENSKFMCVLHSKFLREYMKPVFNTGDRVRISKYDLSFRKGYKLQFTREVSEIVANATRKPPSFTIKDKHGENIEGKFYQKELIKVNQQWTRLQWSWFPTRLEHFFQTIHPVFFQTFYRGK